MRILGALVPVLLYGFASIFMAWTCAAHASDRNGALYALQSLPTYKNDRAPELADEKLAQLQAFADAVERHTRSKKEAAFLIAWGWHETAFSLAIVDGQCRPLQCDRGRARGAFQEHRIGRPLEEWDRLHGLGNIDAQVESAARRARGMLGMCKTAEGAFRSMTGRGCSARLPGVERRVATYRQIAGRL